MRAGPEGPAPTVHEGAATAGLEGAARMVLRVDVTA